jgi:membrane protein DedA with SNARE-associated domain
MLSELNQFVLGLADIVPLEIFVFAGSLIEEIIAPIPSPIVLTTAGALAATQQRGWLGLGIVVLLGAIGKTLGAWALYWLSDKLEDALVPRFGKYLGLTHAQVEALGAKFGKGWKDDVALLIARSLPIIPSAPISVACGLIKLPIRTYLWTTFAGTLVRNFLFSLVGYLGSAQALAWLEGTQSIESIVQIVILASTAGLIVWAYVKRYRQKKKAGA